MGMAVRSRPQRSHAIKGLMNAAHIRAVRRCGKHSAVGSHSSPGNPWPFFRKANLVSWTSRHTPQLLEMSKLKYLGQHG